MVGKRVADVEMAMRPYDINPFFLGKLLLLHHVDVFIYSENHLILKW